jgi:hypothetical protein
VPRGIGIRLVRDVTTPFSGPTVAQVAPILEAWIDSLADRSRVPSDIDTAIVRALQADVALQAHV